MTLLFKAMSTGYEALLAACKMFDVMLQELRSGISYLSDEQRSKYELELLKLQDRNTQLMNDAWNIFVDITNIFVEMNKIVNMRDAMENNIPLEETKIEGFVKELT